MAFKECKDCKFFAQGETYSYCENPRQIDQDRKEYCYYIHGCDLHETGISQTRIDYMNWDLTWQKQNKK